MFDSWIKLGFESNLVIGLRLMRLMHGDRAARREANLMVAEKLVAAIKPAAGSYRDSPPTKSFKCIVVASLRMSNG